MKKNQRTVGQISGFLGASQFESYYGKNKSETGHILQKGSGKVAGNHGG